MSTLARLRVQRSSCFDSRVVNESACTGVAVHTKSLGAVFSIDTATLHAGRVITRPRASRLMLSSVLAASRKDLEILRAIVGLVVVAMMHDFFRPQASAKHSLRNQTVLELPHMLGNFDLPVASREQADGTDRNRSWPDSEGTPFLMAATRRFRREVLMEDGTADGASLRGSSTARRSSSVLHSRRHRRCRASIRDVGAWSDYSGSY